MICTVKGGNHRVTHNTIPSWYVTLRYVVIMMVSLHTVICDTSWWLCNWRRKNNSVTRIKCEQLKFLHKTNWCSCVPVKGSMSTFIKRVISRLKYMFITRLLYWKDGRWSSYRREGCQPVATKTDILTLTKCFFVPKLDHSISTVTREKWKLNQKNNKVAAYVHIVLTTP